ncbi:MAG TPA: hypothetical protein PLF84_12495 [Bryobacteraceae bacterium]|nr:hypothetical protein [Bryobacteraceae bacterium]
MSVPTEEQEQARFRDELARVQRSETFRSSESMRRLLGYLGEAHLAGTSKQLKEYTIGRDVMGKPEDYDPRVDASVRVQIGKLRQKLEQYYREEGAGAPLRVTLPKGHFELRVEDRTGMRGASAGAGADRWRWAALAGVVIAMGALMWGAVGWQRSGAPEAVAETWPEEMHRFWGPFLDSRKATVVVLGSPMFIRFHNQYFRNPLANSWEEVQEKVPLEEMRRFLGAPTAPAETRRWTPLGEAMAAFRMAMVLGPVRPDLTLKRSSVLAWEDVRVSDLIFLGPTKFNPQLAVLPVEQDFVFAEMGIRNLRPREGELAEYRRYTPAEMEDIPEEYALVTRVRGVEGWGEVLALASTTTEGTWAAVEYVTNNATLKELMSKVETPEGMPDRYQVVLRCRFKEQVPIRTEYVTHHVLK